LVPIDFIIIIIIMKAKIIVTLYIKNVTGALYTVNYNENTLSVSVSVNAAWNSVVLTPGETTAVRSPL